MEPSDAGEKIRASGYRDSALGLLEGHAVYVE
jgi:hypothetical protein